MKHWLDLYCDELKAWDRVHRIIGNLNPKTLCEESRQALLALASERPGATLVDVGAGGGILGVPWLALNDESRVVFVEPDMKKAAFLRVALLGSLSTVSSRCLVLPSQIEHVSRETIVKFSKGDFVLAARAFSGPLDLRSAHGLSQFAGDTMLAFSSETTSLAKSFVLKPI